MAALKPTAPDVWAVDEQEFSGEEDMPTAQVSAGGKGSGRFELGEMPKVGSQGPVELGDAGPVGRTSEPDWGDSGGAAAQQDVRSRSASRDDEDQEDYFERRRRKNSRMVFLVVGLLVLLGVGGVAAWNWDKLMGLVTSSHKVNDKDLLAHPRFLMRQDSFESFDKAFEALEMLYQNKKLPDARGLQAETLAIKALYLQFRARDLEDKADSLSEELLRIQAKIKEARQASSRPVKRARSRRSRRKKAASVPKPGDAQAKARVKALAVQIKQLHNQAAGLRKQADGLADRALTYAREALSAASTSVTQRAMAEALLAKGGAGPEALAHLNKAMALGPDDPDNYAARAMFEMARKQWQTAEATLKTSLEMAGKAGVTYYRGSYLLARVLVAEGKRKGAAERLAAILATNEKHEAAKALKGVLEAAAAAPRPAARQAAVARAGAALDAGVAAVQPRAAGDGAKTDEEGGGGEDDYDALVRKGDRYSENGRVGEAKRAYERALKVRPGGVEALTGLAYCYLDRRQRSQAVRLFRRALANSPSFGDALIGLAETYKHMGRLKEALKYYKRYLDSHPGGSRSGLAKRNVDELTDKLGLNQPRPTTPVVVEPGAGASGTPSGSGTPAGAGAGTGTSGSGGATPSSGASGGTGTSGSGSATPSSGGSARPAGSSTSSGGASTGSGGATTAPRPARPRPEPRSPDSSSGGSSGGASGSTGTSGARPTP